MVRVRVTATVTVTVRVRVRARMCTNQNILCTDGTDFNLVARSFIFVVASYHHDVFVLVF
jgi:hypothetical protein